MYRAVTDCKRQVAAAFADWGIPTAESLLMARRAVPELPILASGGIRDGVQMAKAIALGADACGVAGAFLHAANESAAAVADLVTVLVTQLRVTMFAAGAVDIAALRCVPITAVS